MYAVERDNIGVITALLEEGACPNEQDAYGNTSLMYVLEGRLEKVYRQAGGEAVSALLDAGANRI